MIHELSRRGNGAVPGGQLRGAARHAVRVGDLRLREGRVHRRARSQARTARAGATTARCSSTRSATCRSWRRPSCCACSRSGASSGSAATASIEVDFRLISATNRPLDQFVRDSRFREDLYYRVNAFSIRLPSLRERQVDIPVLAQRFLARYCAANGLPLDAKSFSREALDVLAPYHVAGQHPRAREHRLARRAVGAGPHASARPTSSSSTPVTAARAPSRERLPSLREAERAHIVRILEAVELEQEGGGRGPRDQPRHALPEDRRVRARAAAARRGCPERDTSERRPVRCLRIRPRPASDTSPRQLFRYRTLVQVGNDLTIKRVRLRIVRQVSQQGHTGRRSRPDPLVRLRTVQARLISLGSDCSRRTSALEAVGPRFGSARCSGGRVCRAARARAPAPAARRDGAQHG